METATDMPVLAYTDFDYADYHDDLDTSQFTTLL
jgi:hypothetical protein